MCSHKNVVVVVFFVFVQAILVTNAQNNRGEANPWIKLSYADSLSPKSEVPKSNFGPIAGSTTITTNKPSLVKLSYADSASKFTSSTSKPNPTTVINSQLNNPSKQLSYADSLSIKSSVTGKSNVQTSTSNPSTKLSYAAVSKQSTTPQPNVPINHGGDTAPKVVPIGAPQINQQANEDDELRQYAENLLKKDINNAAKLVQVNLQSKTTSFNRKDLAPQLLLQINPNAFNASTISKLLLLHNNYEIESNVNEHVTGQERIEENELIESVINTPVMEYTRNFLIAKGKLSKDPKAFKDLLKQIWFNMYSRGEGKIGSSGFEHVFLAEIKKGQISGLHNWLYFNLAEKSGKANYLGYMKKIDLGDKGSILKYHFTLDNIDKPVGSMFIGTSPELEMSLYTTCFVLRPDAVCPLRMGGHNFVIRTYNYRYRSKNMIGSAFPEI